MKVGFVVLGLGITLVLGCRSTTFDEAQQLGGQSVAADVLNRGEDVYKRYCSRCHGSRGNGRTTAMRAEHPPLDLTLGVYKFSSVPAGQLPVDADFENTLATGLGNGRVMPSFKHIPAADRTAVIQYLKTLSSRWRDEEPGRPISVTPDPWGGRREKAVRRGADVYHLKAKCWTCHPAYVDATTLKARLKSAGDASEIRAAVEKPERVQSVFGPMTPPDFRTDELLGGTQPARLFTTISAGISGTAMPTWAHTLSAADRWSLAYYVHGLVTGGAVPSDLGTSEPR